MNPLLIRRSAFAGGDGAGGFDIRHLRAWCSRIADTPRAMFAWILAVIRRSRGSLLEHVERLYPATTESACFPQTGGGTEARRTA